MQKGFYDLTSGMLTQNRILNNISNNLANVSTPGFKRDLLMTKTFDERMQVRTGNIDHEVKSELHDAAMLRTVDEIYTVFEQGGFNETGRALDFAIDGEAFFQIQKEDGTVLYTRNGSFTLDDELYLQLQNVGRVLDDNGNPVKLSTDKITADSKGVIRDLSENTLAALGLVHFEDNDRLLKTDEGMFTNPDAGNLIDGPGESFIRWKFLEGSNVNLTDVFKEMITSQRAFQSASQILKMYDEVLAQTVSEVGKVQ